MPRTLGELAQLLDCHLARGEPTQGITGITEMGIVAQDKLAFYLDTALRPKLVNTAAAGLVTDTQLLDEAKTAVAPKVALLVAANPKTVMARAIQLYAPTDHPLANEAALRSEAQIGEGTNLGQGVVIGRAVIGKRCSIGKHCYLASGVHLGDHVILGDHCALYPNVVVYANTRLGHRVVVHAGSVLGSDGFGYVGRGEGAMRAKIPHLGCLVVEDDVEIGANSCIDRATLHETRIGRGSKIDNLVHISHNVSIGKRVIICGQVGIAGSTQIGDDTIVAAQSGINGHIRIGKRNLIYGASVVIGGTPDDAQIFGYPARDKKGVMKELALARKLPAIVRRLLMLEKRTGVQTPQSSDQSQ